MADVPTPGQFAPRAGRNSRPIEARMLGVDAVMRSLEAQGVDTVFGLPGADIGHSRESHLASDRVRHVSVRHEQGGGHAAEGYALATGKVGVIMTESGPGAASVVTPIFDANADSVPLVAITARVGGAAVGRDASEEADIVGMTMAIAKFSILVTHAEDIPSAIAKAFYIARSGRPGAVLVDIVRSALLEEAEFRWPPRVDLPGYHPVITPNARQLRQAGSMLAAAERPVLLVGGGVLRAGAEAELARLVKTSNAAVVTTMSARGAIPDADPHNLGMLGRFGTVPAVAALRSADLVMALGTRLSVHVTGELEPFAPDAAFVHVDIDPAEISRVREADVPIVGDVKAALPGIENAFMVASDRGDIGPWWEYLDGLKSAFLPGYPDEGPDGIRPEYVLERLGVLAAGSVWVTGTGRQQLFAAHFLPVESVGSWVASCGAGTQGYALPAAIGVQVGRPDATVWAIDGEGSFLRTAQELDSARKAGAPVKVALIDNVPGEEIGPDYTALARAYGCEAIHVERVADVDDAIRRAMAIDDHPVVVDFRTVREDVPWPLVDPHLPESVVDSARPLRPRLEEDHE